MSVMEEIAESHICKRSAGAEDLSLAALEDFAFSHVCGGLVAQDSRNKREALEAMTQLASRHICRN